MSFSDESLRLIRILAAALFSITLALLICHLIFCGEGVARDNVPYKMFHLGMERNIPSWFATILWLFISLLSLASYYAERIEPAQPQLSWFWLAISTVFLYFSADEAATIHEEAGEFLRSQVDTMSIAIPQGSPGSPWIVFYAPVFAIFGICFLVFLWNRFSRDRRLKVMLISALGLYAVAISLDYFQGTTDSNSAIHARSADKNELSRKSVIVEEVVEDLASSLLVFVLAFNLRNTITQKRKIS
jgi:hypothetical protein